MEDINVVIAGAAGEGVQTVGDILAHTISAQGYAVFTWQEYESRIRGGQNSFSIRIGENPQNAPLLPADILLALNEGAANKYESLLKEESILIAQGQLRDRMITIPFTKIAQEELGDKLYANTIAIGALVGVLGVDLDTLNQVLVHTFRKKGNEVVESNLSAAEHGYRRATQECRDMCPWKLPRQGERYYLIAGNEAIPLAAAFAGCRFIAAYPMTPSTGIITFFAQHEEQLGVFAEQAEDEIAAVNMALGASYAGARAMTATSGGGFALMVEGVSLAGMTETPLVVVLAQRPGPATGLPTRTAQGELLFAINAGHGEFPKLVLAPSTPHDAFHKMVKAFNLADKYQMPAIVLTDHFLADSQFSVRDFELGADSPRFHLAEPRDIDEYKRYQVTEQGVSPRLYPGQSEHLVGVDSDEHDESGHITEDLDSTVKAMVQKRLAKIEGLKREISPPEEISVDDAHTVLVGWGSSRGALLEGLKLLEQEGTEAGMIQFTELWPLPEYTFPEGKTYITVESNATGQLARLLRSEYGVSFHGTIHRYDGLPLTGKYIRSRFNDYHG
ncbi:MAG: 2-oxoacid:acceptor oxidoreductase subunit alpha [Thermodesulfobacteriota bacterium]